MPCRLGPPAHAEVCMFDDVVVCEGSVQPFEEMDSVAGDGPYLNLGEGPYYTENTGILGWATSSYDHQFRDDFCIGDGVTVDGNNVIIYFDQSDTSHLLLPPAAAPLTEAALNGVIVDALAACVFINPCAVATDVNGNVVVVAQATSNYFNGVQDDLAEHDCFELIVVSPDGEPPRTITTVDGHRVWLRGAGTRRLDERGQVVSSANIHGCPCCEPLRTIPEVSGPPRISIDRQGNIWCANFFGVQYITNTGLGAGSSEWNAHWFWKPYSMSLGALASRSQQAVLTVLLVGQRLIETELEWALPEELWFCILGMIDVSELGAAPRLQAMNPPRQDMFDSEILADGGQLGVVSGAILDVMNRYYDSSSSDEDTDPRANLSTPHARWKSSDFWCNSGSSGILSNTRSAPRPDRNRGRAAGRTHQRVQARQEQHERGHGRRGGGGGSRGGGGRAANANANN